MNSHPGASQFPPIFVDERDYEKLSELAAAAAHSMPDVADSLLTELERATVVGSGAMPPDIVRLGSRVTYKSDNVARRQITPAAALPVVRLGVGQVTFDIPEAVVAFITTAIVSACVHEHACCCGREWHFDSSLL